MSGIIVVIAMCLTSAAGTTQLKSFVATGNGWWLVGAAAAYAASNALYVVMLRSYDLGIATVIAALAQIILLTLAGRILFAETLTTLQIAGIALGLAAMAMVLVPTANG